MTDPDTNYATNAQIQKLCFKNQTTPGTNTIEADELLEVKTMIDDIINVQLDRTSNYTSHASYPIFKTYFIKLFKKHLREEEVDLKEREWDKLIAQFGSPAIACDLEGGHYDDVADP